MQRILLAMAAGIALSAGTALAAPSQADKTFAVQAARSGIAEVRAGQLATEKATSQYVRQFGRELISNHSTTNGELAQIAGQEDLKLPTELDAAQQAQYRQLASMSGSQFNTAFPQDEIANHQQAIAMFSHEAQAGQDPALRSFAQKTLPILRQHLRSAQSLTGRKSG